MSKQEAVLPLKQRYENLFCAVVRTAIKEQDGRFFEEHRFERTCTVFGIGHEGRMLITERWETINQKERKDGRKRNKA